MTPARRAALLVAIAFGLGCASLPRSSEPVDWSLVAYEETPRIVTLDPDGSERETPLWLVVVDGDGYVRTGESRWKENLRRDAKLVLHIGGARHPMRAEFVTDAPLRVRIHAAFRAKYGLGDRVVGWFADRQASHVIRLVRR